MSLQAQMISGGVALARPDQSGTGPYVINLCSSTTPMALPQPQAPELKRFKFFISRRREDGRERFRLHMGYFETIAEAEEWLATVRDIYPGAWVGEAPGKRLAQKAAEAAQASVTTQPSQKPTVPTLHAPQPETPPVRKSAPVAPAPSSASAAPATTVKRDNHLANGSNLREVLASLDDTDTTRQVPTLKPNKLAKASQRPVAAPKAASSLSDTQVLEILEGRQSRRPATQQPTASAQTVSVPLLRPDDTATLRTLKDAVQNNKAVAFAVQLQWSIQPIAIEKVPPLAIFNAYTLYTVEGSREGRKWYGLRLGFFEDAISAKQVATYVRSEFASVAVVPVSPAERIRATEGKARTAQVVAFQRKPEEQRVESLVLQSDEFKLIDDPPSEPKSTSRGESEKSAPASKPVAKNPPVATRARREPPGKGRVRARERRPPQTLEETLEILGASALQIDEDYSRSTSSSGVRHLRIEPQKNSSFSRLLDRLTERVRRT